MQADTSKRTQRWGPLGVLALWCVVMGVLYAAMEYYLKPKAVVVTAQGALVIPKACGSWWIPERRWCLRYA